MTSTRTGPHVVVVGAGVAGLSLARTLIAAGSEVTVIEARDRVGGRLHSVRSDVGPLDLGATWFWPGEARVGALTADLGLTVHPQFLDGDALFDDGTEVRRLDGNPLDVPSGRWTDGAHALAEGLAAALPAGTVSTGEAARTISVDGSDLVVETSRATYHAGHVALALPPALAVARLRFRPELDSQLAELARTTPVWMGAITKVVVSFTKPFWRTAGLSGSAVSHRGPLGELHDMSGPDGTPSALFGFAPRAPAGGPDREAVIAQLVRLFGSEAHGAIDVHVHDWRAERWTSPADVEAHTGYHTYGHPAYAKPVFDGRLHWTSTETSPVAPGHVEGALAAAERTAAAILNAP